MKKALAIIILGCLWVWFSISNSFAADIWTGYQRIDKLDVQDNYAIIYIEGNDGCRGLYRLEASRASFKEKLSLLMGAFFAGYEVSLKYRDTRIAGSDCEYPILKARVRR